MAADQVRATIKRVITIEYDVYTGFYDSSYTRAQVLRHEIDRSTYALLRSDDYEIIEEVIDISETRPQPVKSAP